MRASAGPALTVAVRPASSRDDAGERRHRADRQRGQCFDGAVPPNARPACSATPPRPPVARPAIAYRERHPRPPNLGGSTFAAAVGSDLFGSLQSQYVNLRSTRPAAAISSIYSPRSGSRWQLARSLSLTVAGLARGRRRRAPLRCRPCRSRRILQGGVTTGPRSRRRAMYRYDMSLPACHRRRTSRPASPRRASGVGLEGRHQDGAHARFG
jgi:hypothetical protein